MKTNVTKMGDQEFNALNDFVFSNFGVLMPNSMRETVQEKLQKRLKETNIKSFRAYCDYLFSNRNEDVEFGRIIDFV